MQHFEGNNIGSIAKLEIAFHTDFSSFNPAVLQNGKQWFNILFKEESGFLKINVEETENGLVYSYSGAFFIHRIRPEVVNEVNPYLGQLTVMRITDINGEVYIIGAPGVPVTLTLDAQTGEKYTAENGSNYTFATQQSFPYLMA